VCLAIQYNAGGAWDTLKSFEAGVLINGEMTIYLLTKQQLLEILTGSI
jgi:hypothetical protein